MLSRLAKRAGRIPGKIKSNLLRLPIVRSRSQRRYEKRLVAFAHSKPHLSATGANVLVSVEQQGTVFTSLDKLSFLSQHSLLESIEQLLSVFQTRNRDKENSLRISQAEILRCPSVFKWGLHEELLDVVENWLGLPAFYHRVEVRKDLVNKEHPTPASQWHRDVVDHRVFKLIVYLNDVYAGGGPFEFIPSPETYSASRTLKYRSGYVSDTVMERAMPKEFWQQCTGPCGSVIVSDTASVFHRIRAPVIADRLSITFTYTSRNPIRIYDRVTMSAEEVSDISKHLTERQHRCLFLD